MRTLRLPTLLLAGLLGTIVLLSAAAPDAHASDLGAGPRLDNLLFRLEHHLHAIEARLLEIEVRLAALERVQPAPTRDPLAPGRDAGGE